ncbi:RDD family protein [Streptomyces sp. NPDC092296]|uniref:RDD family protein n=1 Tax=Streptomyces sp. NPDC092296 TaxID=3366012 RepID=UPI0038296CF7
MSSPPPAPDNPRAQQPEWAAPQPDAGYGYPPQPGYGYPQVPPQPGYGYPPGDPYGYGAQVAPGYAGWGSRVAATLLDGLFAGIVPMVLLGIGFAVMFNSVLDHCDADGNGCDSTGSGGILAGYLLMIAAAVVAFGTTLWFTYQEGTTGQTPGKRLVNIRVLREVDGQPLGFGMALVRRICHAVDGAVCYLGYLWPLWDAKKQTFADKIMGTVVIGSGSPGPRPL